MEKDEVVLSFVLIIFVELWFVYRDSRYLFFYL